MSDFDSAIDYVVYSVSNGSFRVGMAPTMNRRFEGRSNDVTAFYDSVGEKRSADHFQPTVRNRHPRYQLRGRIERDCYENVAVVDAYICRAAVVHTYFCTGFQTKSDVPHDPLDQWTVTPPRQFLGPDLALRPVKCLLDYDSIVLQWNASPHPKIHRNHHYQHSNRMT